MSASTDLTALKGRQRAAWPSRDYAVFVTTSQIVDESLAEACALDLTELLTKLNRGGADSLVLPSECREVVATGR